jgi:hypothetical protein
MALIPSAAHSHWTSEGIPRRKWSAEVYRRVYKSPAVADPCSEPRESNPRLSTLFLQDQLYVIFTSTRRSSKWPLYLHVLCTTCCIHVSYLLFALRVPRMLLLPSFDHACNMWWRAHFVEVIIHVSPDSHIRGYQNIVFSPEFYLCVGYIFSSNLSLNMPLQNKVLMAVFYLFPGKGNKLYAFYLRLFNILRNIMMI